MKDLAKKTEKVLRDDLQKKRDELREMNLGMKPTPHGHSKRQIKRDIARLLTELNSRGRVA